MSDPVYFRNLLNVDPYERDQCIRGELGTAGIPLGTYTLTQDLKYQTGTLSALGGLLKVDGYEFHIFRARDRYNIQIWRAPQGIQVFKDPEEPRLSVMPPELAIKLNSLPNAREFIRADGYAQGLTNKEIQEREGVRLWHVESMDGLCTWAAFIRDNVGGGNWKT